MDLVKKGSFDGDEGGDLLEVVIAMIDVVVDSVVDVVEVVDDVVIVVDMEEAVDGTAALGVNRTMREQKGGLDVAVVAVGEGTSSAVDMGFKRA